MKYVKYMYNMYILYQWMDYGMCIVSEYYRTVTGQKR